MAPGDRHGLEGHFHYIDPVFIGSDPPSGTSPLCTSRYHQQQVAPLTLQLVGQGSEHHLFQLWPSLQPALGHSLELHMGDYWDPPHSYLLHFLPPTLAASGSLLAQTCSSSQMLKSGSIQYQHSIPVG